MAPKAEPKADAKAKAKAKPKAKSDGPKEAEHVPKPDKAAMEKRTDAITEEIEELKKKKEALTEKINSSKGGKDEFFRQKSEISAKISQFKEKIDALHAQKDELSKGVNKEKADKSAAVQDVKKLKASIGFKSEEEMDKRLQDIEYRLQTETIQLKEEKALLKEMQELKRNRPKVGQINKLEEGLAARDPGSNVKETLQTINEQIRMWMQEKAKVLDERKALEEAYDGKLGDNSAYEERNKFNEKIREKQDERNKIRDAFREEEREFRELMNKKRQEQQEWYAAERESKQKEWEGRNRQKKVEKLDEQPFVTEITLLEQTIKFCKSLTSGKDVEKKEEKKDIEHNNMDGLQVLSKKDERDEFWFEPTKAKKNKGSKPKGKEASKPIKHNAVTFKLFDQLKLDAPITLDDIPPTLEKLEAELVKFEAKVADWEKNKEERKAKILAGEDVEDEKDEKTESKEEEKEEDKVEDNEEEDKAEEKEE